MARKQAKKQMNERRHMVAGSKNQTEKLTDAVEDCVNEHLLHLINIRYIALFFIGAGIIFLFLSSRVGSIRPGLSCIVTGLSMLGVRSILKIAYDYMDLMLYMTFKIAERQIQGKEKENNNDYDNYDDYDLD